MQTRGRSSTASSCRDRHHRRRGQRVDKEEVAAAPETREEPGPRNPRVASIRSEIDGEQAERIGRQSYQIFHSW